MLPSNQGGVFIGTSGDDVITPSSGGPGDFNDTLDGGLGNDTLDGGNGSDLIPGGGGNDLIVEDFVRPVSGDGGDGGVIDPIPGASAVNGPDTVDVGAGLDSLTFMTGPTSDTVSLNLGLAGVTLGLNGALAVAINNVEAVTIFAGGGADSIQIGDLTATPLRTVTVDLTDGAGQPDGAVDTISLTASAGRDQITASVAAVGGGLLLVDNAGGVVETTALQGLDPTDAVNIALGGGDDSLVFSATMATAQITANGGDGNDTIAGSGGADTIIGGQGADVLAGGGGDDRFVWNLGDGADTIDGGAGLDTQGVTFGAEKDVVLVTGASNGPASIIGQATLSLDNVETLNLHMLGGGDSVQENDLSGTKVRTVNVDFSAAGGAPNGQADFFRLQGAPANEVMTATVGAAGTSLSIADPINGVAQSTTLTGLDNKDTVEFLLGSGNDTLTIGGGVSNATIAVNGQGGNDSIAGGAEVDNVTWVLGNGADTVDGGAGADSVTGFISSLQGTTDTVSVTVNGDHAILSAQGAVGLDLVNVETLEIVDGVGADTISAPDLSATAIRTLILDVGQGSGGSPDIVADQVFLSGAGVADQLTVTRTSANVLTFTDTTGGVTDTTRVTGLDGRDTVTFNLGAGDDRIDLSAVTSKVSSLIIDGGAGNDTIVSGAGGADLFNDTQTGQDLIQGFHVHSGGGADVIGLANFAGRSFAELVANGHLVQAGSDVLLTDGSHTLVTLAGITVGALSAADFLFT